MAGVGVLAMRLVRRDLGILDRLAKTVEPNEPQRHVRVVDESHVHLAACEQTGTSNFGARGYSATQSYSPAIASVGPTSTQESYMGKTLNAKH